MKQHTAHSTQHTAIACFVINILWGFLGYSQINPNPNPMINGFNAQNTLIDPCNSILAVPNNPTWVSQSDKIYSACPNVKVGIGTTNPTHSIHTPYDARFGQVKVDFNQGIGAEPTGFSKLFIKNQNQDAAIEIDQSGNSKIYQKLMVFQYTNPTTEVLKVYNPTNNQIAYLFEANGKNDS